jgi:hypothetical protein
MRPTRVLNTESLEVRSPGFDLGELGARESHEIARESGADEVATVEDNAREVEVQALPGQCRVVFEVCADESDDGQPVRESVMRLSASAWP